MRHMSRPEWREFALHGTRTGKLAVTRKGGAPHVTPVWFLLDSDAEHDYVLFTTESSSVKGRALRRDPRFALTVDDQAPPYSCVLLEATATLLDDADDHDTLLHWAQRLGARYMGEERGAEYGKRNAVPGELLVRGTVTRAIAPAGVAD